MTLGDLSARPREVSFAFPGGRRCEPMPGTDEESGDVLIREQQAIEGSMEVQTAKVAEGLFRLTLRVVNRTPQADASVVTPRCRPVAMPGFDAYHPRRSERRVRFVARSSRLLA